MSDLDLQEKLKQYSIEIFGEEGHMSLDTLIQSHRLLRAESVKSNQERIREFNEVHARAAESARQMVMHGEFISVERLRSMTLGEIAEFIGS